MNLERQLSDWISAWLKFSENSEAPTIYDKWVAVSMVASVLERKTFLQWDKRIYPNIYIVLVGPPGGGKGTAMSPGRRVLDEVNIKIASDATTKEQLVRRLKQASDNFEASDGQIYNYAAMTVYSEEFTVFLGYGNAELLSWLSDWYDCKEPWDYETKHQGKDKIDAVWVNLIGATTPELLRETIPAESFGGGLNSRIIYVFAGGREKDILFPYKKMGQDEELEMLTTDLQRMRLMSGQFQPSASFEERWADWYPKQKHHDLHDDEKTKGYASRRATHLLKLSMIMNTSRNGNLILEAQDFDRARHLLLETEREMKKTFAGFGTSRLSYLLHKVLEYIRRKGQIRYSQLQERFAYDADEETMPIVIATLERAKLIGVDRQTLKEYRDILVVYTGGKEHED